MRRIIIAWNKNRRKPNNTFLSFVKGFVFNPFKNGVPLPPKRKSEFNQRLDDILSNKK